MRAVVTGGAGFIGSHIAEALLARGDEVVVVDSLATGSAANLPGGVRFIEGDVRDASTLDEAFSGVDVVFHQAALGSVPRSIEDPVTTHGVNTTGTLRVLNAALRAGVAKVVAASSSSVYGGATSGAVAESTPTRPRSPYAASKVGAEAYLGAFAAMGVMQTVALRYFNVYGPRQDPSGPYAAVIPRFLQAVLSGSVPVIYGDGSQTRDFTYVTDVVRANLLVADAPSSGVYNVGSGVRTSISQLLETISHVAGGPAVTARHEPPRTGDVAHSLADVGELSRIGYSPEVGLEDGLRSTMEFLQGPSMRER